MIDGKKFEMSQKLAIYELMNAKLKQANIDLEQQLARSESLCVALDVKYNSAALGIVQLDQQLEDLREVFKGMRHIDCRGTGGYHSIEHDEWLAALNNDKNRVGE